jgi:hypothetical protein
MERTMSFDPHRDEASRQVVGYGAGRHSTATYAAMTVGVLIAMVAVFSAIAVVGNRTPNANHPVDSATTGHGYPGGNETPGIKPRP